MHTDNWAAAILAGGSSRRMGTNKALLRLQPGGPRLIETVVSRVRECSPPSILLVTNTPAEYVWLGLPTATDEVQGVGPLAGILSALTHSEEERVLVVACDMPMLNPSLLKYMLTLPRSGDVLIPRWHDERNRERVETLHAIYSRRCIGPIRKRIAEERFKVADLLEDVEVQYVPEYELRWYDPQLASFRNVNTPEEWEQLLNQKAPEH